MACYNVTPVTSIIAADMLMVLPVSRSIVQWTVFEPCAGITKLMLWMSVVRASWRWIIVVTWQRQCPLFNECWLISWFRQGISSINSAEEHGNINFSGIIVRSPSLLDNIVDLCVVACFTLAATYSMLCILISWFSFRHRLGPNIWSDWQCAHDRTDKLRLAGQVDFSSLVQYGRNNTGYMIISDEIPGIKTFVRSCVISTCEAEWGSSLHRRSTYRMSIM